MDVGWTVTAKERGTAHREGSSLSTGCLGEPQGGSLSQRRQDRTRSLPQVAGRGKAVTKEMQESQPRWEESGREF